MSKLKFYHQGLMLRESLTHIQESEFLTALPVNEDLSQLTFEIRYFQSNTMDFADDSQLSSLRQKIQDAVKEVSTRLAAEKKKSPAIEKTGARRTSRSQDGSRQCNKTQLGSAHIIRESNGLDRFPCAIYSLCEQVRSQPCGC